MTAPLVPDTQEPVVESPPTGQPHIEEEIKKAQMSPEQVRQQELEAELVELKNSAKKKDDEYNERETCNQYCESREQAERVERIIGAPEQDPVDQGAERDEGGSEECVQKGPGSLSCPRGGSRGNTARQSYPARGRRVNRKARNDRNFALQHTLPGAKLLVLEFSRFPAS